MIISLLKWPRLAQPPFDDLFLDKSSSLTNNRNSFQKELQAHLNANPLDFPLPPNTPGLFIHLGKAGGSSLSKQFRHACHSWLPKPCINVTNESILSLLTTYIHTPDFEAYETGKLQLFQNYRFIVLVAREPLARFQSAFVFQHPLNELAVPSMRRRFARVFACYPTLQVFANRLMDSERTSKTKQQTNNTMARRTCTDKARAIMTHGVRGSNHLYYDYRFIEQQLIQVQPQNALLFVIRTEFLWHDWTRLLHWVGDIDYIMDDATLSTRERDISKQAVAVDKTLNQQGRQALCRALEDEYRVYLKLVKRADNLSIKEKLEAVDLAKEACPELNWSILEATGKT